MRLKIGEFARLGQVSVQTLRYYDGLGLLKPGAVDRFNGYRYYTLDQLPALVRIVALKDLGLSLDEIQRLTARGLSDAELRGLLTLKRQELHQQVQEQLDRLERIEARLRCIDAGEAGAVEVIVKRVEPLFVASARGTLPDYWSATQLWEPFYRALERAGIEPNGPMLTLYHAAEPEIDMEVCAPVPAETPPGEGYDLRLLPGHERAACALLRGPFSGIQATFTALMRWIDANGYELDGPDREVYLRLPDACCFDSDPDAITELQAPVRRRG